MNGRRVRRHEANRRESIDRRERAAARKFLGQRTDLATGGSDALGRLVAEERARVSQLDALAVQPRTNEGLRVARAGVRVAGPGVVVRRCTMNPRSPYVDRIRRG